MKRITFLTMLLVFVFSSCKEKLTYIDTIVGKYEGDQYWYNSNDTLLSILHGFIWIDKIEGYEDRVNLRPGNLVLRQKGTQNMFKHIDSNGNPSEYRNYTLIFQNDSVYFFNYGTYEYYTTQSKKIE